MWFFFQCQGTTTAIRSRRWRKRNPSGSANFTTEMSRPMTTSASWSTTATTTRRWPRTRTSASWPSLEAHLLTSLYLLIYFLFHRSFVFFDSKFFYGVTTAGELFGQNYLLVVNSLFYYFCFFLEKFLQSWNKMLFIFRRNNCIFYMSMGTRSH